MIFQESCSCCGAPIISDRETKPYWEITRCTKCDWKAEFPLCARHGRSWVPPKRGRDSWCRQHGKCPHYDEATKVCRIHPTFQDYTVYLICPTCEQENLTSVYRKGVEYYQCPQGHYERPSGRQVPPHHRWANCCENCDEFTAHAGEASRCTRFDCPTLPMKICDEWCDPNAQGVKREMNKNGAKGTDRNSSMEFL